MDKKYCNNPNTGTDFNEVPSFPPPQSHSFPPHPPPTPHVPPSQFTSTHYTVPPEGTYPPPPQQLHPQQRHHLQPPHQHYLQPPPHQHCLQPPPPQHCLQPPPSSQQNFITPTHQLNSLPRPHHLNRPPPQQHQLYPSENYQHQLNPSPIPHYGNLSSQQKHQLNPPPRQQYANPPPNQPQLNLPPPPQHQLIPPPSQHYGNPPPPQEHFLHPPQHQQQQNQFNLFPQKSLHSSGPPPDIGQIRPPYSSTLPNHPSLNSNASSRQYAQNNSSSDRIRPSSESLQNILSHSTTNVDFNQFQSPLPFSERTAKYSICQNRSAQECSSSRSTSGNARNTLALSHGQNQLENKTSNYPNQNFSKQLPELSAKNKDPIGSNVAEKKALTDGSSGWRMVLPNPTHPLHPDVISYKKDQDWVNLWLKEKVKPSADEGLTTVDSKNEETSSQTINQQHTDKEYKKIKLNDVHSCVGRYKQLLSQLESSGAATDGDDAVKNELDQLSQQILDPEYHETVKNLVEARRKKRQRRRNRKKSRQEEWQRKSDEIDRKRQQIIEEEKEVQRVGELRSEADAVLQEVRGKQQEASNLQLLLSGLRDLRQHRLNRGEQQGYVSTEHHDNMFARVMDGLDEMVESQLHEYSLEERTVRAMLEHHHTSKQEKDKQSAPEVKLPSISPSVLEEILFGCAAPADAGLFASYTAADTSMEMLRDRRRAWDQHLITNTCSSIDSNGGSGVPLCWVTPPSQPRKEWLRWRAKH